MGTRTAAALVVTAALAALGGWLAAGGCGNPERVGPAAVRGTVTFQGRPLAGGMIVFAPDRDRGTPGRPLAAAVAADGTFRLDGDPVPPGWYRVAIADPPDGTAAGFPAPLRRPDRSGLGREVRAGKENVFHFAVEVGE